MYEKILEKLKKQREESSNVTDRSLEDLARSLETVITTDDILTVADLTNAIKSIDGNINHYTATQVKAIETKNQEDAVKKAQEEAAKKAEDERLAKLKTDPKNVDIAAIIAESIKSAVEPLTNQISELKGDKIATSRSEKVNKLLKDAPDYYKNQITEGFKNLSFENDDTFNTYLGSTKTNLETFQQKAKEQGLNTAIPNPDVKQPEKEELNPTFAKAMAAHDEQKALDKEKE